MRFQILHFQKSDICFVTIYLSMFYVDCEYIIIFAFLISSAN